MKVNSKNIIRAFSILAICLALLIYGIRRFGLLTHSDSETANSTTYPAVDETSSIEALKSLPYMVWAPIEEKDLAKTGVTKYDSTLSYKGINLYHTENKTGGYFFDMNGNILHTFIDKTMGAFEGVINEKPTWLLIEPYSRDYFIVLIKRIALMMIDWDSNIKWVVRGVFHHDFAVADNGDIYVLTYKDMIVPQFSRTEKIKNNWLVILTKDGKIKKEISFSKMLFQNKELFEIAMNIKEKRNDGGKAAWDVFHANTLEIINRDIFAGDKKLFKKGDVLFCLRHQDIVGVIDIETEKIIWHWGTYDLDFPHQPSLLENGNLLIFDNGYHRNYSRVIELNPVTKKIERSFQGNPPESFYTATRGSAQRLPNGNTLITESDKGHVFEITKDGKVVWEFFNPEVLEEEKKRATIYRMMRIIDPEKYPRLKKSK
jgi:hypothetical protein